MPAIPARLLVEIIAALALITAGIVAWQMHDRTEQALGAQRIRDADAAAVVKQAAAVKAQALQDAAKLAEAHRDHEKELSALAVQYGNQSRVVCHSTVPPGARPVPDAPGPATRPGAPAGVLRADADVHPDITGALYLLARRADTLAADARELERAAH